MRDGVKGGGGGGVAHESFGHPLAQGQDPVTVCRPEDRWEARNDSELPSKDTTTVTKSNLNPNPFHKSLDVTNFPLNHAFMLIVVLDENVFYSYNTTVILLLLVMLLLQ